MKTKSSKSDPGLESRSAQLSSEPTAAAPAAAPTAPAPEVAPQVPKPDSRLPIDIEARKANRSLPTPKVLNLLHAQSPAVYRLAEVVGKWVWVTFTEQPAAEVRQMLAQLGFHWNRERQSWQHPCGQFSLGSAQDPHEKYGSYFPVRVRNTPKPTTAAQPAAA
jgi:hypothetical protein